MPFAAGANVKIIGETPKEKESVQQEEIPPSDIQGNASIPEDTLKSISNTVPKKHEQPPKPVVRPPANTSAPKPAASTSAPVPMAVPEGLH